MPNAILHIQPSLKYQVEDIVREPCYDPGYMEMVRRDQERKLGWKIAELPCDTNLLIWKTRKDRRDLGPRGPEIRLILEVSIVEQEVRYLAPRYVPNRELVKSACREIWDRVVESARRINASLYLGERI